MTLKDINAYASLNKRKFEAFGGEITIRDLSIAEMTKISTMNEEDAMLEMVAAVIVEPKVTVKDLKGLSGKAIEDMTRIVEEVNGSK